MFFTSPAKRREGDRAPKSAWWRGQAAGTALRRTMITTRARAMRKAMTEPEVILWTRLRGRAEDRPTFRRQHPFGSIILDFYCPSLRLAIEVDGATHWDDEAQLRDAARDRWLAGQGVHTVRIPASRIYHDLDGVMDEILLQIENSKRGG
jgi:very-short-patch-repair endonuclease